jgi:1-acyl-sn-glycerol-3-phosphate acyltransferase
LSRFKIGPFKLALKTNRRILVIGISGAYEFSNTNSWFLNPGMVVIHTGVLVDLEGKDEDELRDEVRCAMLDCMKKASIVRNS